MYWFRSVWFNYRDFVYSFVDDEGKRTEGTIVVGGLRALRRWAIRAVVFAALFGLTTRTQRGQRVQEVVVDVVRNVLAQGRGAVRSIAGR